jgi:hypothetical protein
MICWIDEHKVLVGQLDLGRRLHCKTHSPLGGLYGVFYKVPV